MIDVIIPLYNSHKTICQTLSSIYLQTYKDRIRVYLIDDYSNKNYDDEISIYKNLLDITYLKLSKNSGPGVARQFGIDNSKSEFIIFMDSDDQFYNSFSVEKMYKEIKDNDLDLVIGLEYRDDEGLRESAGSLHGKIYKRKNLIDKNIKFNNTYYSEDNSFNKLVMCTTQKYKMINEPLYIYRNNKDSLTNKESLKEKILIFYIYNMIWCSLKLKKYDVNMVNIWSTLYNCYVYAFSEIKKDKNSYNNIYSKCYRLEILLNQEEKNAIKQIETDIKSDYYYDKDGNKKDKKELIENFKNNIFEGIFKDSKESIESLKKEFQEFRKKFIFGRDK